MKFHEAIDMILAGGETYTKEDKDCRIYFDKRTALLCSGYDDSGHAEAAHLFKEDLIGDNWIVEKEGIVYEEYHQSL